MRTFGLAAVTAALATTVVADIDPIVIKGSKFFYSGNGTQLSVRRAANTGNYTNSYT